MTLTPDTWLALGIGAGAVLAVGVALLLALVLHQRRLGNEIEALNAAREADRSPLLLQQQMEALRAQVGRALDANTRNVGMQLGQLSATVNQRLHDTAALLQQTQGDLGDRMDGAAQLVGAVQRSLGGVEEASRRIYDIGKDIASLQQILQAPKLRGGLGELLLEDVLAQVLPAESYAVQYAFRGGQKVDAVIRLGGGLVPVDAKFPLENFRRLLAAAGDDERARTRRAFVADVKRHVDAVAGKYILPDEGTFDFALMYVPAENVYYEIVVRDDAADGGADIHAYALGRRVILVSPGSFYAYLQSVVLGLRGLRIEKSAHEILRRIGRLEGDLERFRDEFRVLGKHIAAAHASLAVAERRLERVEADATQLGGATAVESSGNGGATGEAAAAQRTEAS